MQAGTNAPAATELSVITAPVATVWPQSLSHATLYLINFRIAVHTFFSGAHPLTQAYDEYLDRWNASGQYLLTLPSRIPSQFPSLALRWLQLQISWWFKTQASSNANVPVPPLTPFFEYLERQVPWEPTLPASAVTSVPHLATATTTAAVARATNSPVRRVGDLSPTLLPFKQVKIKVRDAVAKAGQTIRSPTTTRAQRCAYRTTSVACVTPPALVLQIMAHMSQQKMKRLLCGVASISNRGLAGVLPPSTQLHSHLLLILPTHHHPTNATRTTRPAGHTPTTPPSINTGKQSEVAITTLRKYISTDTLLLSTLGWDAFVQAKRQTSDFGSLPLVHPAIPYLRTLNQARSTSQDEHTTMDH